MSKLQKEIQQRTPFSSIREEALLALFHTVDALHRRLGGPIEEFGVTTQQYNVLRILRGAGSSGLPTLDIADRMIERAPGITRMIDRLEAKGLVSRERGGEDRRQVVCRITHSGLQLLTDMDETVRQGNETTLSTLEDGEVQQLIGLLDRIREGF